MPGLHHPFFLHAFQRPGGGLPIHALPHHVIMRGGEIFIKIGVHQAFGQRKVLAVQQPFQQLLLGGGTHGADLVVRSLIGNGLAQGFRIGEPRLPGNFIIQFGQDFAADLVQSALEGNGLAAQILHRKNIGTDHGGLALFPGMQGADERVKFAHLLPFLGSVELHQVVFGLHAFHGLAFIFSVDIHQHHILILRQAAFRHIFQARHGTGERGW